MTVDLFRAKIILVRRSSVHWCVKQCKNRINRFKVYLQRVKRGASTGLFVHANVNKGIGLGRSSDKNTHQIIIPLESYSITRSYNTFCKQKQSTSRKRKILVQKFFVSFVVICVDCSSLDRPVYLLLWLVFFFCCLFVFLSFAPYIFRSPFSINKHEKKKKKKKWAKKLLTDMHKTTASNRLLHSPFNH